MFKNILMGSRRLCKCATLFNEIFFVVVLRACVINIIFPPATRLFRMTKRFLFSYCLSKTTTTTFY